MPLAHDVLGVRPGASDQELRAAFRRFARAHHPDRGGDPSTFQVGLEAYERLTSPTARSQGAELVFHRRPRGLGVLTAGWRSRRRRRQRPARVK